MIMENYQLMNNCSIGLKDGNNGYFPLVTVVDNGFRGILLL
jgi:hypothetical protein